MSHGFKFLAILFSITFISLQSFSKKPINSTIKKQFASKVSELYTKYKLDGFETYKGGTIQMEKNTEFPIFMELKQGHWYQFAVVGDPECRKFEMKLMVAMALV